MENRYARSERKAEWPNTQEQFSELLESIGVTKNDMERDCAGASYRRLGAISLENLLNSVSVPWTI